MQRMMITLLIAFAVGIVLGKAMLPVLHKLKFGQNIYELAPEAHKKKQGTPTMGGLVIAGAAIVAALIMNDYSQPLWQNMLLAMLVMALGNLCIGFVDDMTKIRRGKNGGLTPKQKMFFQTLLALAFSCYCYFHPQVGHVIQVPFFRVEWDLGIWYIPIMMFIIVGTTNSANLLDGLDGLLTSVSMVDFATLAVLCGAASLGSLGVGCAAMCGACMAFLSRNAYPAQMFMGDTGSLFLGGAVAALAECPGPLVVISADTAISLMAVNAKQELVGGVILPGPQLSMNALVQKTAQLPQIDPAARASDSVLGKSTSACLQNGFVLGTASLLDGLADRFCAELGAQTAFYATGDLPRSIREACRTPIHYRETLITDGLHRIWLRRYLLRRMADCHRQEIPGPLWKGVREVSKKA